MLTPPTVISQNGMTFVITGMPREYELNEYIELYKRYNVTDVVRTCKECVYNEASLLQNGITSHELVFDDGTLPSDDIINKFLEIVNNTFFDKENAAKKPAIAVHCRAGLGRAPTLVVIALIEKGMSNMDAINVVKKNRPQAFNQKQLMNLSTYRRKSKCMVM